MSVSIKGAQNRHSGRKNASLPGILRKFLVDWGAASPLILLGIVILVFPCIAILRASFAEASGTGFTFKNWVTVLSSQSAQRVIGNSLVLGATVTAIALLVGAPLAWCVSRMTRSVKALHLGLLTVANNFSGIGLAFGYVAALGTFGMVTLSLKAIGIDTIPPAATSFWGLVIAYEYGIVPMFVLLSLPAMSVLKDEWWEACQCCSASRWQFWRHVGFPVLGPFFLATSLLIFTWSVGLYGLPVALLGASQADFNLITLDMSKSMMGSLFGSRRMPVLAAVLMIIAVLTLTAYRLVLRWGARWL